MENKIAQKTYYDIFMIEQSSVNFLWKTRIQLKRQMTVQCKFQLGHFK